MADTLAYEAFQAEVLEFFAAHQRHLPWRLPALPLRPDGSLDPYAILVSEVMLQQTQVNRVIPKFQTFMTELPTMEALAQVPLAVVLQLWSGLGYNRRARFLHAAAQAVVAKYNGTFPRNQKELATLPGIGHNTAGAIMAYAFNEPMVFIETNIRTVFIHYFFQDHQTVHDKQLVPLIEQTLDRANPREWYWALMDLGSTLKKEVGNASRASASYAKQSRFEGSRRQVRGRILKLLLDGPLLQNELFAQLQDDRAADVLADLVREGLVAIHKNKRVELPR